MTLLDYWIEDTSEDPITVWIKVKDSLDNDVDIYCYYGKNNESSASDGEATFEFFDDFEDGSYTDKWDANTFNGASVDETGGNLEITLGSGFSGGGLTSKNAISSGDWIIEARGKRDTGNKGGELGLIFGFTDKTSQDTTYYGNWNRRANGAIWGYTGINKRLRTDYDDQYLGGSTSLETWDGKWCRVTVTYLHSDKKTKTRFVYGNTDTTIGPTAAGTNRLSSLYVQVHYGDHNQSGKKSYCDWIAVRKYTSPEPSFSSAGSEETSFESCTDIIGLQDGSSRSGPIIGSCSDILDSTSSSTLFLKAPWLSGFSYRKRLVINGSNGAGTGYQIKLKIGSSSGGDFHLNGHCSDFPNDIRFTKDDGLTLLKYWIEDPTQDPVTVWIKVEDNLDDNVEIYCYYGSSLADSLSNGNATFEFFDDFNPIQGNKFEDFERYENNPLSIPQYSSDGVVHPDVLYFPDGMDGYKYWMVYTPYPPESTEDPSIVRSNDGITWTDTGISNPVIPNGGESWRNNHQHDPDFLYVPQYSKWFMVWGGVGTSGDASIAFAYSSDGKNWTEYDGTAVNGNTNPVILNGNDDGGQSWERDGDGKSKVTQPTLFFDTSENKFYLFYGEVVSGNNRGKVGYATFTWNNDTNDIENFQRYSGNPIIDLSQDSEFKSGCGHLDISYYNGTYYMYVVREILSSANFELCLLTSTNKINWVCEGKVLERGSGWESKHIYRSSPVTDGVGNVITFSGDIKLYYSAFDSSDISKIGLAYGKEEINKLDTDKWTRTSRSPSASVANSILTLKGTGLSNPGCGKGTNLSWSGGYAARARVALKEDYSYIFFSSTTDDIDASAKQAMIKRYNGNDHFYSTVGDGTNFAHVFSTIQKDANYHIMEMRRTASTAEAVIDDDSWFNNQYAANDEKYLWIAARGTTSGTEVDWILVRKYVSPEPSFSSAQAEEGPVFTCGDILANSSLSAVQREFFPACSEVLSSSDFSDSLLSMVSCSQDSLGLTDSNVILATLLLNAIDSMDVSDSCTLSFSFTSSCLDVLHAIDSASYPLPNVVSCLDSLGTQDSISSFLSMLCQSKDNIGGADGETSQLSIERALLDILAFQDTSSYLAGIIASASDVLNVQDLNSIRLTFSCSSIDVVKNTDSGGVNVTFHLDGNDILKGADFVSGNLQVLLDSLAVFKSTDQSASSLLGFILRSATDVLDMYDLNTTTLQISSSSIDIFRSEDNSSINITLHLNSVDVFKNSDSAILSLQALLSALETLKVSDSSAASLFAEILASASDLLATSDYNGVRLEFLNSSIDVIKSEDRATPSITLHLNSSDILHGLDSVTTKLEAILRAMSEFKGTDRSSTRRQIVHITPVKIFKAQQKILVFKAENI